MSKTPEYIKKANRDYRNRGTTKTILVASEMADLIKKHREYNFESGAAFSRKIATDWITRI